MNVIKLWSGEHEKRIRIPGVGDDVFDAVVIILPVITCRVAANHVTPRSAAETVAQTGGLEMPRGIRKKGKSKKMGARGRTTTKKTASRKKK